MIFSRDKMLRTVCSLTILLALAAMPLVGVSDSSVHARELPQEAPVNPDFIEFWENPPDPFYGYIPPPIDLSHLDEIPVERAGESATLPNSFDWRDQGKVTSVRDQNPCGTCWVHGTLAAVESKVLIEESTTYDFSEQNLICCTDPSWVYLIGNRCSAGGWSWLAADTLTKKGTRLESCQPYNTGTIDTEACGDSCQTIRRITDYRVIAWRASAPEVIEPIKSAVYNNGPLAVSYCHDDSHLYSGSICYWPNCTQPANHLVCIVGWDDTIAHPGGGGYGAWIVKNSWGTGWGDNGYFYLCYGSANMGSVCYFEYQDYDPNETVYYWDEAGWVSDGGYGDNSAWMASVFTSNQDGSLSNVEFWTTSNNAQYDLYVYNGSFGSQLAHQTGSCEECGYYSVSLGTPVSLNNGQQFTVAVKMTTPGYNGPIPLEKKWAMGGETLSDPVIQSGVSFIRHRDSDTWEDAAEEPNPWNVCLRAVVSSGAPGEPDITLSPTTFHKTLAPGTTQDYTLTITNTGDATLSYNISDRDTTGPTALPGMEPLPQPSGQIRQRDGLIELNLSHPVSFPTAPTTGAEIAYDDATAEDGYCYTNAGDGFAVRFTPPGYPVELEVARFFLWPEWPDLDHEEFGVWVFDDDGPGGAPGTLLNGTTTTATDWGWCDVDISSLGITITSGDFYIAYEQLSDYPDCEALGVDWTDPDPRSWDYWWGEWYPAGEWYAFEYDYMTRCVLELGGGNNPPNTPSNPSPAHQATGVSVDADLSWTGSDPDTGDTLTYDVHFGTSMPPPLVSNDQSATSYDPGTLDNNTKYYWKVVATDNHATSTPGPVWHFTAAAAADDCPWLDQNSESGSLTPGDSDSITVTIDTTGLTPGEEYSAEIVIANNDPDESPTIVPVNLAVAPPGDEANPDVATGLAAISSKLLLVYGYSGGAGIGGWTVHNPEWATTHPEWNSLTTLYMGRGYWLSVSGVCDLTYGANTYELDAGWNLIGWLGC